MTEKEARRRGMRGNAPAIAEQLPRRRRRLGVALVALGVVGLAAQTWGAWLLPYDTLSLERVQQLTRSEHLTAPQLAWAWALLCLALLAGLAGSKRPSPGKTVRLRSSDDDNCDCRAPRGTACAKGALKPRFCSPKRASASHPKRAPKAALLP